MINPRTGHRISPARYDDDMDEATTRTYGPNAPLQKPFGGFSRMKLQDLKDFIKKARAEVKNSTDPARVKEVKNWIQNAGSQLHAKQNASKFRAPAGPKYKYTIARQHGGDDGYQWTIFDKKTGQQMMNGLTKPEVKHYRDRAEADLAKKYGGTVSENLDEASWDYSTKDKGKGPGWSSPMADGGKKNRKNRKAFRKAEKKKKHDAMMRGEEWAQEVPEAIVPYQDGQFVDDETGQIHQAGDVTVDADTGEQREKTSQEWETGDREARPEHWAARDKESADLEAELATDIQNWEDEPAEVKKMGWDAIGDFG
jgi:hypothetical protein